MWQWFSEHILHIDKYLVTIMNTYQAWTYLILFGIIFCETGFVVTPFLPGDSLIFAAASLIARPPVNLTAEPLNIWVLWLVLCAAAILGDTVNYWIGNKVGHRAFRKENARILKKKYLDETHQFYEKYGGFTIVLARFVPIVRTFAPFVAGMGSMTYSHFLFYNVFGGIAWVSIFTFAGYFFGKIKFVQNNFSVVIIAIIAISVLPMVIKVIAERRKRRAAPDEKAVEPAGAEGDDGVE